MIKVSLDGLSPMLEFILSTTTAPLVAGFVTFLVQEIRYNRNINLRHKKLTSELAEAELSHVHQIREDAQQFLDDQMVLLKQVFSEERDRLGKRISHLEEQNNFLIIKVNNLESYNQELLRQIEVVIAAKDQEIIQLKQKVGVYHQALLDSKREAYKKQA